MLTPNQLPTFVFAALLVFLNGALSVASGFGAAEVLVCACVPVVFSAATLVVTVVLLETLVSLDCEPEELEEDEGFCVVVNVLPAELTPVMICPAAVLILV